MRIAVLVGKIQSKRSKIWLETMMMKWPGAVFLTTSIYKPARPPPQTKSLPTRPPINLSLNNHLTTSSFLFKIRALASLQLPSRATSSTTPLAALAHKNSKFPTPAWRAVDLVAVMECLQVDKASMLVNFLIKITRNWCMPIVVKFQKQRAWTNSRERVLRILLLHSGDLWREILHLTRIMCTIEPILAICQIRQAKIKARMQIIILLILIHLPWLSPTRRVWLLLETPKPNHKSWRAWRIQRID